MGLPEIVWRIGQSVRVNAERIGIGLAGAMPASGGAAGRPWLDELPVRFDRAAYEQAAERILAGRFNVFSLRDAELGFPPDWNRDPRTGTRAPMTFGKTLDYRSEALVGDIKYLWEPNRHLEAVTLAQAWHLSGDARYAAGVRTLLESWFRQCPYPRGPNWISPLEHALRLVNWSYAWHLLGGADSPLFTGDDGERFERDWLACVYRHLHFIRGHLSHHSSANNHLLGEYMGLFIGTLTWPMWRECADWNDLARHGLENECLKQNGADGSNREQAIWYEHEVADMLLHCGLVGRANGVELGARYWERLVAILEHLASIMDVGGHVPMLGDSDDAVMVRFAQEAAFDPYRSLLAAGAVLFERGDFKVKAGELDDKSRWLLGDGADRRFAALPVAGRPLPVRRAFPDGGQWLLGDGFESPDEVRIVADAGPLGYLSIAAHGHADALAFTMSVRGREILVDSGTYTYHAQKRWRDYFRGTSAHNTVRVDGEDQSVSGGSFLWLSHAQARCEAFLVAPERDEWQASHDGYLRLRAPVRHRRRIVLDKRRAEVEVTDVLEGAGRHRIEIFWHFSERCAVRRESDALVVRNGDVVVELEPPAGLGLRLVRGSESRPLGWISRRFDEKTPITTLVCEGTVAAGAPVTTRIRYGAAQREQQ